LVALAAWLLAALFLAATLVTATFAALFALFLSASLALAAALPALVLGLIWHHILLLKTGWGLNLCSENRFLPGSA
jgi:hypothetical protein